MFKIVYSFLLFMLVTGIQTARSQFVPDSSAATDTVQVSDQDTVSPDESSEERLLQPVGDSIYSPMEKHRAVPAREVNKYLNDEAYAYANDSEYWKKPLPAKPSERRSFLNNDFFRWIVFLGIAAVILFGIYQLAKENSFRFFTRKSKREDAIASGPVPMEETDFESAIQKYYLEGNYRMAIRFLYLRLIDTIRQKGIIQFRDSSTNAEIARAFGNHPHTKDFIFLARAYEYIYYGDLNPQADMFTRLRNKFETFQHNISA